MRGNKKQVWSIEAIISLESASLEKEENKTQENYNKNIVKKKKTES